MEKKYIKPTTDLMKVNNETGICVGTTVTILKPDETVVDLSKEFSIGYVEENQRGTEYHVYNLWED